MGPFRREELRREIKLSGDGAHLVRTYYRLWYDPAAVQAVELHRGADAGGDDGGGQPGDVKAGVDVSTGLRSDRDVGSSRGGSLGTGPPEREFHKSSYVEEDWCLRTVGHQEFRDLADEAGLRIVAEYPSFTDGLVRMRQVDRVVAMHDVSGKEDCDDAMDKDGSRVFVLGIA